MPISAPIDNRSSTILFRIPHVSKLLAFKDVLKNKDSLVALLTAMLKLGLPEILYVGYDDAFSPRKEVIAKKKRRGHHQDLPARKGTRATQSRKDDQNDHL